MNDIQKVFNTKKKIFIIYLTCGFPSVSFTTKLIKRINELNSADIVELGLPFSDPIADGPTIQFTSNHALKKKLTTDKYFNVLKKCTGPSSIPIILMTYYNLIFSNGVDKFLKQFKNSGGSGIIIPDIIPDLAEELITTCKKQDLAITFLAAENTSDKRLKLITEKTTGFIYFVSYLGTTGSRKSKFNNLQPYIKKIKKHTDSPVSIGFGVSNKKDVKQVWKNADGVIIGSAILKFIKENLKDKESVLLDKTLDYIDNLHP